MRDSVEPLTKYERSRKKMVETQIRARGITEARLLAAMERVPRHLFVSEAFSEKAYGDHPLPIGEGQTISQPYMVATMIDALDLQGEERVLEIGTGSGYQAAVLAELSAQVFTIERIPSLGTRARELLENLGYTNIAFRIGDGTIGWREASPFDAILVSAAAPKIPKALTEQLADGGRLAIPIGGSLSQVLKQVTRRGEALETRTVCGCVFVPLIGRDGWP